MIQIDLHTHSTFSDGSLTPSELIDHAASRGVQVLALTDHDGVDGLTEAAKAAAMHRVHFVNGTEISVTWQGTTLHIVGLKIDPTHPDLRAGLASLHASRHGRAEAIATELAKVGIKNSLEGAYACAAERSVGAPLISRTHFAYFLVEHGYAKSVRAVFQKYLVPGKPGFVPHRWADLTEAVNWINASGGVAVLAHPGRYGLDKQQMQILLSEFKAGGGAAIEVVTGSHTPAQYQTFAELAGRYGLLASMGSDYHGPQHNYLEMGQLPPPPAGCTPLWHDWDEIHAA